MGEAAEESLDYLERRGRTYLDRMEDEEHEKQRRGRGTLSRSHNRQSGSSEKTNTERNEKKLSLFDFAPEIIALEDDEDFVNLMVYGNAGVGKTVLAGSHPRVLFLAPEDDGTISAKRQGSKAKKFPVNTFEDWANALNIISENIDDVKKSFDWIAIDSITHLQRQVMRQILDDAVNDNPERDPDIPQMQDWQKYQNMFLRYVQAVNDLPINVIWTALERSETDEEGDEFLVPDIQGKGYQMAMTVASYMTSYGRMVTREVDVKKNGTVARDSNGKVRKRTIREITWTDKDRVRGKDRTDVLAPMTRDLTLENIDDLISGKKTRADILADKKAPNRSLPNDVNDSEEKLPAKKAPVKRAPTKKAAPKIEEKIEEEIEEPETGDIDLDMAEDDVQEALSDN